jgi:hypothetical protein
LRPALFGLLCLSPTLAYAQSGTPMYSCEPAIARDGFVVAATVLAAQAVTLHVDGVPVPGTKYTVLVTERFFGAPPDTLHATITAGGHCLVTVPRTPGSQVLLNLWPSDTDAWIIGYGSRALRPTDHDLSALKAATP